MDLNFYICVVFVCGLWLICTTAPRYLAAKGYFGVASVCVLPLSGQMRTVSGTDGFTVAALIRAMAIYRLFLCMISKRYLPKGKNVFSVSMQY